ncbi:hypothetical protein GDO86_015205 [Hymenochirus boettgeri]|uniref:NF-kappa-B inhibitor epsilon n=1 Tax=Hymenochirus boettgeri TaxID=247094 RepID=A0A8T2JUJ5_9PIPI|nr:hypothetical protein GDO86_015205 [Hymenochirus boettgeri]
MSDDWDEKKLPPDDSRYDSGIADSVQSFTDDGEVSRLQSLPEESGPWTGEPGGSGDKVVDPQELDRVDSLYESLTELLPNHYLPASFSEEPSIPDPQQVHCLTYLSEEGDTIGAVISPTLSQTGLHLAVYLGQLDVVETLVSKGVNLDLQDRKGDTALHVACKNRDLACSKILLKGPNGPQNLHLQNWEGRSCLHIATLKRDHNLISLLLDNGADINDQEGTSGKTPLHLAVEMLDGPLLTHLLTHHPSVDSLMYNGCTPLHLAVGRKDADLAHLLCQAGADTLRRNREGDTPQDLAEGNNQISGRPVVTSA